MWLTPMKNIAMPRTASTGSKRSFSSIGRLMRRRDSPLPVS
jgi:hypothetical protein